MSRVNQVKSKLNLNIVTIHKNNNLHKRWMEIFFKCSILSFEFFPPYCSPDTAPDLPIRQSFNFLLYLNIPHLLDRKTEYVLNVLYWTWSSALDLQYFQSPYSLTVFSSSSTSHHQVTAEPSIIRYKNVHRTVGK